MYARESCRLMHLTKKTNSVDGLQYTCRECQKAANRKSYEKRMCRAKLLKVFTNPELAKFSPRDLMTELKARGFKWEYMLEPQRKIMYEKL